VKLRIDDAREVTVSLDVPPGFDASSTPVVFLGHGISNDMESPFLRHFSRGLGAAGYATVRFNFPFKESGEPSADPREVLVDAYRAIVRSIRGRLGPGPTVLAGKSLGARMASHLAAEGEQAIGLAFLGYPLHAPDRPDRRRDEHFPGIPVPTLFLQGDRDPYCDLSLLLSSLWKLGGEARLHAIAGGDHAFRVESSSGRTDEDALDEALSILTNWLESLRATL
jgi:uncharacterized protein